MRAPSSTGWTSGAATYDSGFETHNHTRPAPRCSAQLSRLGFHVLSHLVPSPVALSKSHRFPLVQFRENRTRQETPRSLLNHARYDNYGNKWLTAGSNNSMEPLSVDWIDAATNRLSTTSGLFAYDNAGNLTLFGGIAMA